jgi:hypothetical protein
MWFPKRSQAWRVARDRIVSKRGLRCPGEGIGVVPSISTICTTDTRSNVHTIVTRSKCARSTHVSRIDRDRHLRDVHDDTLLRRSARFSKFNNSIEFAPFWEMTNSSEENLRSCTKMFLRRLDFVLPSRAQFSSFGRHHVLFTLFTT